MKSIKIKLEKTYRMFKSTGFLETVKVLCNYLAIYLKAFFLRKGDVLFVTSGVGDSAMYRAYNTAEELRMHGISAQTTITDNPRLLDAVDNFKIFVFHRTAVTSKLAEVIEKIKAQKKEIIFDTDDLVYDPKYFVETSSFASMSANEKEVYRNGIGAEIVNDPYAKVCTTTVSYLADKLKEKGKEVFVVSNKIANDEWNFCQEIIETQKPQDGFVRIAYASGTLSHNFDFASIKGALIEILEKYEKVKLYLMGPLDIPEELKDFRKQIEIVRFSPRRQFLRDLYKADINLAPLELGIPFCEAKSEIKFSEAGAFRIPTVAVKNQTFSESIIDGADGFLAESQEEWVEKLSRLIENEKLRKDMGKKAYEKVLRDFTVKNSHEEKYYQYLKNIIQK